MADTSMRIDLAPAGALSPAGVRPRRPVRAAPAARGDDRAVPASRRAGAGTDAEAPARARPRERRWLHGLYDFLLLGGGSFLVLAAMAVFFPRDEASRVALAGVMLFLSHFVNHPHFAHSYQIFYRGFLRKAFPPTPPSGRNTPRRDDATPAGGEAPLPAGEASGVRGERGSALPAALEPAPESSRRSAPASSPDSAAEPAPASAADPALASPPASASASPYGSALAARYRFAGILIPAVLAVFFAAALAEGSVALLGLAANVMVFTVGWHYAKQGYGILMLDAARKGIRFGGPERRRLLWNTHLAWVANWLAANDALSAQELWGITWYTIDVPDPILAAMVAAVAVSTLAVGRDLFATWRAERALPLNGLLAYIAAVYVWLAASRLDPVLLLVVPFFHSLQYLGVVWRYQLAVEADRSGAGPAAAHTGAEGGWKAWLRSAPAGLARFLIAGGVLGFAGFWLAPVTIDTFSGYDQAVFGATLFLFIGWTFINIHHYFIDNVIWRRDNPEARRYLFGGGAR